ncbi:MAG: Gfo/Idh/MocA family oxidoreductase [Candidatus Pacebacteria bacterium]|nr:Gfo/Idh/MocA family oxidoreductase [Candidatus Paceibacterota bacterium]
MAKTVRVGVVGYGGAFNMGLAHLNSIVKNKGFEATAVCEIDPARLKVAEADFPGIHTFSSVDDMLAADAADLVIIITPHDTHAPLALQCLNAGLHVVCEKPLAITSEEVLAMVEAAKKNNVMLSTFHNRRWDGDFEALRKLVKEGLIGDVFRIECGHYNYGEQKDWWRSNKDVSGGAIYDWGAHFTDWILNIVDDDIESVTGFQVKNPKWSRYTNEDHSECRIQFKNNCVATLTISFLSMEGRPRWRVLGTKGSIVDAGGSFTVKALIKNREMETSVPYEESKWDSYYKNVADHLVKGKPLVITPESAARVICVLDAADTSAEKGGVPVVPAMP